MQQTIAAFMFLAALASAAQPTGTPTIRTEPVRAPGPASVEGAGLAIPGLMSYQGRLLDSNFVPVPDTVWTVQFRLYTQASGGTHYWQETQTVRTADGLFAVLLGSQTPVPYVPASGDLYLGMKVGTDQEMVPRTRIVSAAYAFLCRRADTADYVAGARPTGTAGGDLSGTYPNPTVGGLQGRTIAPTAPAQNQVLKWQGNVWTPANDSVGGGGGGSVTSVSQSTGITCTPNPITTTGTVALNTGYSDGRYVNVTGDSMSGVLAISAPLRVHDKAALGYSCYNNGNAAFCAGYGNNASASMSSVTGGEDNSAGGNYSHVSGGSENRASANWSTIGGGNANEATDTAATVGGGRLNVADGIAATVGGGHSNDASGDSATVGGGANNTASDNSATVGGGRSNTASGPWSTVGGGVGNRATYNQATVGGGNNNEASGHESTIAGGFNNRAFGPTTTVGGGFSNIALRDQATVGGGRNNRADSAYTTVGGGISNRAAGPCATIGGGSSNAASGDTSTIGGGIANEASGRCATVGGGSNNIADRDFASVGGGWINQAVGYASHVGGGEGNEATGGGSGVVAGSYNYANGPLSFVGSGNANYAESSYTAIVGGHTNDALALGAFVGGGGRNEARGRYSTVSGGHMNIAEGHHATIAGGKDNRATGDSSAVGGGGNNTATGPYSTVGGGGNNTAGAAYATVPGGNGNAATGQFSLAAGRYARARHLGSFVWSDGTAIQSESVYTTGTNQFRVRARGGTWFYSNAGMTTGAYLAAGSNSWASACDSANKGDFRTVDRQALLERLTSLPVRDYKMKDQDDGTRHIGPVAQDFHDAFGYGETNTGINLADADGVLLAAVQALYEKNRQQQAEIEILKAAVAKLGQ